MKICSIEDCYKPVRHLGWCEMHYTRNRSHGDPLIVLKVKGRFTSRSIGEYVFMSHGKIRITTEQRVVAEKAIGKPLPKGAVVHHVNEDKHDNRNSNLVICPSNAYHRMLHTRMAALAACGHASWRKCRKCKEWCATEDMIWSGDRTRNIYRHAICPSRLSM